MSQLFQKGSRFVCARRLIEGAAPLLAIIFCLNAFAQSPTNAPADGVVLKVLNREVMTFRANLGTYSPEQRVTAAEVRIERALQKSGTPRVDFQIV